MNQADRNHDNDDYGGTDGSNKSFGDADNQSKIVLLGTGTPNALPHRSGPSLAIVVKNTSYLVDFGPGVIRRASAASEQGIKALEPRNLNRAFLTHLHSDHTAGLPDLLLTPWVLGRDESLELHGPSGLKNMTSQILAAYDQDIRMRIDGLEGANDSGWRVTVNQIESGMVYRDRHLSVEAFPANHGSWPAFGYKFITPDRVIVISGDTTPTESLVEMAKGCDVLIHEVYSQKGFEQRSPKWQCYHKNMHTSTLELADIASQVRPGLLILYHQLFWGVSEEELLQEIRDSYDGEVVSGKDLDVF